LTTPETSAWAGRSLSAKATENVVVRLLETLTEQEIKIAFDMQYNHSQIQDTDVEWGLCENNDSIQRNASKDEHIAVLTFQLYVDVYRRLSKYYEAGLENPRTQTATVNIQTRTSADAATHTDSFYENRMLAMRICEDQMHLVERHGGTDGEYKNSRSWELLFNLFMHQRQLFAELKPK
jgi:hypothetical protein